MAPTHTGLIEFDDLTLALTSNGAPRRIGTDRYLVPPGDLTILHPFSDAEFYRHGWNSWSPTGWRRLDEAPLRIVGNPERLLTADDAKNDTPWAHSGSGVGALGLGDGRILLLGALGLGAPRVGATTSTLWGTTEVPSGEWFLGLGEEVALFHEYAELLADRLGRRTTHAGRVWSTWYSCYEDIDEDLVRTMVEDVSRFPFDVIQIDDGWMKSVGDWEANDKFCSGMPALASLISSTGARAGLWLAPFIALPASEFARQRTDLLISTPSGEPMIAGYNWGGPYFCLDTTQEEVQDHIRRLFERLCGWGFSYFKLDFMYAAALEGIRHVDVHREQAYRDAVALIRETVGEDVYLLGSGVPMIPSIGIFDGVRVGPDVAAFWDNAERPGDPSGVGAKNSLQAGAHRYWLKSVYETDPDAVYFRRRRSLLDERQRQAVQDMATILGFKSTSDPISWLDEEERRELREWLESSEVVEQEGRYLFSVDGRQIDMAGMLIDYVPSPSTNGN